MQNNRTITPDTYRVLIIVLWVGIAGVFIRIWGLWNYAFNPDEAMLSRVAAADSFSALWEGIKIQTNGPLIYGILHLLIMFSKNELLLRCISLIPGAGLIFIFYFLGKRVSGTVSGVTMACLCAFGYGAVQISQVVRPYSMLLLFLSGALYFFTACLEKPGKKYFYGYSICMLLATATHYSAVIFFAAIGCVWLLRSIIKKEPSAEYRSVIMAHLPPLALFCILCFFHISHHLGGGGAYGIIKETYLAPLFPQTFLGFVINTYGFFKYLFLPLCATLAAALLSLLGIIALWNTSRRALAATIVLTFAITIVFTIVRLFPFGGSRHSMYLFPLICLLVGASIQYGFDVVRHQAERLLPQLTHERNRIYLGWALVLTVMLSVSAVTLTMRKSDFLRQYKGGWDFPVTRADYDRIMGYLISNTDQHRAIVTNSETYNYFVFFNSDAARVETKLEEGFYRFGWKGLDCYQVSSWRFESPWIINATLRALKVHADMARLSAIYLVNIGWGKNIIKNYPCYKTIINKQLLSEGGYVYALSPQAILREIDAGRFRNTAAATPLPDNAFKSDLSVEQPQRPLKTNARCVLNVLVKNISPCLWPSMAAADGNYEIHLSYHVLNEQGTAITFDGTKIILPFDLGAGQQIELQADITLPDQPGRYFIEFDMVQEKVAWFAAKGSQTKRISLVVE